MENHDLPGQVTDELVPGFTFQDTSGEQMNLNDRRRSGRIRRKVRIGRMIAPCEVLHAAIALETLGEMQ